MHRQGLIAALLILALALAGCGGGDSKEASSPGSSASAPASTPPTTQPSGQAQLPAEARAELREGAEKASREREEAEQSPSAKPPQIEHTDSGGGSAQLKRKGADNSIAEYGSEAGDSEREAAAASLHAYLDSIAARRFEAACAYMSAALIAGLEQLSERPGEGESPAGCAEQLAALSAKTPQSTLEAAAQADVISLRVQGERAFAIYRGAGGEAYAMPMGREEGVWRVGALAGAAAF